MSEKKGRKHYPEEFKERIRQEHKAGASIQSLRRKYGVSRWAIHCWCGLSEKVNIRQAAPLPKGRPRRDPKSQDDLIRRLQMENELLRNFVSAVGRK